MYLHHYGLDAPPFSITPDPRFVFLGERHRDALAHLRYGIEQGGGGGFVQLTGEVGTGKTTLSRLLLAQLPDNVRVALILNPQLQPAELLEAICEELHLDIGTARGSAKAMIDVLNRWLLQAYADGLRVVLIVDEAQNLSTAALEQVRLLTNLETDTQKLLQVVLLGQPELRTKLEQPELRQLAQRITARYHLTPLAAAETAAYLRHRWRVAGGQRFPFSAGAVRALQRHSGGVPRLLNVIAERALLAGYARDAAVIDTRLANAAAAELVPAPPLWRRWPWLAAAVGLAVVAAVPALAPWLRQPLPQRMPDTPVAMPASAPSIKPPNAAATPAPAEPATSAVAADADTLVPHILAAGASPLPAWAALLQAWRLPPERIAVLPDGGCLPANGSGLICRQGRTSLERLLALERPVLLQLRGGGAQAWALLLGADNRMARLQLGATVLDVPRGILQLHWDGSHAGLWRMQGVAEGGADASTEEWVRARLHAQPGFGEPGPGRAALVGAIRHFQRAHGLPADGMAGPDTLMALAADLPGPRLARVLE